MSFSTVLCLFFPTALLIRNYKDGDFSPSQYWNPFIWNWLNIFNAVGKWGGEEKRNKALYNQSKEVSHGHFLPSRCRTDREREEEKEKGGHNPLANGHRAKHLTLWRHREMSSFDCSCSLLAPALKLWPLHCWRCLIAFRRGRERGGGGREGGSPADWSSNHK